MHGNHQPHYRPFTILWCCICPLDLTMTFLRLQLRRNKGYKIQKVNLESKPLGSIQLKLLLVRPELRFKPHSNYPHLPISLDSIDCSSSNKPGSSSLSEYEGTASHVRTRVKMISFRSNNNCGYFQLHILGLQLPWYANNFIFVQSDNNFSLCFLPFHPQQC